MTETERTTGAPTLGSVPPAPDHNLCGTGFLNDLRHEYDPWQHLGIPLLFPGIAIRFTNRLPDSVRALTNFEKKTVTVAAGLDGPILRSTMAHEIVHLERGATDVELHPIEERICDLVAASRLIPVADLCGLGGRVEREGAAAVAWSLNIDESMLDVGLALESTVVAMMNDEIGSLGDWHDEAEQARAELPEAARS